MEGQRKLKAARVLSVGAGGLGSPVSMYLAAAGVGTIGIVDFDTVDLSNLQRQLLHSTSDVGRPKLDSARDRLTALNPGVRIETHPVVLFMKGTPQFPQCGFSGQVVQILDHLGVPYKGVNVLDSDELRQGIKAYSNWPTIPQLYVKGEFVGGCDIVREMFQAGELQQALKDKGVTVRQTA